MTRSRKIAAVIVASLAGLVAIVLIAGIIIVQTDWFRNMVREKIVASVEDATGGTVNISSFNFDWRHLRARVRGFVIHGLEPANVPPLLRANLVQVDLKLLPRSRGLIDIAYLLVDTPQANLIVFPDGHTNIPAPKIQPKSSDKTGLETIVDLAIGQFDLRNGSLTFAERKSQFDAGGRNLRAQVQYNALTPGYSGEIDAAVLLKSASNPALNVDVALVVKAEKDKVTLTNARFRTPQSEIVVSGFMDHLIAPRVSGHLNARVTLDEIKQAAGVSLPLDTRRGPHIITADVAFSTNGERIQIQAAHARLGQSDLDASGTLRDASRPGSLQFRTTLALGELGRLFRVPAQAEGTLQASGNASMGTNGEYKVTANLAARDVAIRQGKTRLTGLSLDSALAADSRRIELVGLRLAALGGSFRGSATIQDLAQFHIAGNLQNFDSDRLSRIFRPGGLGYDGVISGPIQADGSLRETSNMVAKANLAIAPGSRGIPVAGHIGIDYEGRAGIVTLDRSHLALPHTTADFSGSLGQQIQVRLASRSFDDFKPLAAIPITFTAGGTASINATVSGSLSDPRIAGQLALTNFAVDGRPFTRFGAGFAASRSSAAVTDAVLNRGTLQAQFSGTVGLHNWSPENDEPLMTDVVIRDADLRDILALANQANLPVTGTLNADAHIAGTIGSPTGAADFSVARGSVNGQPFDSLTSRAVLSQTTVTVSGFNMVAGASRIDATASYRHAVNDLHRGTLTAHVASNQLQLAQFQSLVKNRPGLRGLANWNTDVSATIAPGGADGVQVQVTSLNAAAAVRNLELEGKPFGDFSVNATTAGSAVRYNVVSNLAGSTIRIDGQSLLTGDHQTTANAVIANLPLDRVLALAGRRDLPLKGTLAGNVQLSGTLQNPQGSGSMNITNGSAYNEPFSHLQASIRYTDVLIDLSQLHIDAGPSSLDLTASFHHPAGQLNEGQLQFQARSSDVQLSRIHTLSDSRPGLAGLVQLTAGGTAALHRNGPISFSDLNANLTAHNLSRNGKNLGNLTAAATTRGNTVDFNVNSDLANSRIQGTGRFDLAAGYPVDAQLSFTGVTWSGLSPLLAASAQPFDGSIDGQITVAGLTTDIGALSGNLQLTKVEAHSNATATGKKSRVAFQMHNAEPILLSLANSMVTVQSFRLTGPYTNLTLSGGVSLKGAQSLNLKANGDLKLEMLEAFDADVFSSGGATLNATVTGNASQPVINGRLQLQNASFNLLSAPNGLSNASGSVNFNGTEAEIQNITGQTGGGKVTLAGFVSYAGPELQFRVQATAARVHIDYPESVTTEANARLTLTGRTSSSLLSGNVTILNVTLHSSTDVGSILTSAATPPSSGTATSGILAGVRFDVRVQTATGVQFRTNLSQNLQGDANVALRGTVENPGMIGRFEVTSGEVVFFGAKYTVDQATVTFSDPNKINPVVNASLETTVQGVDVNISVSGPMAKLKLSYRSDPPLEFSQIVSLLAAGKTPTTDPVLASQQPPAPEQSFEQAGASTILGQAIANPISGRLQRLFGVTRLSLDPQLVGGDSTNPQATLTLQQQITRDITFTYIQDVSQSTPTAVRIEWAISPRFSAIAQRDIYGEFALDFFYKRRFH